jgi:uncharacterized protein YjbI with pentapeptide repeats
MANLEHLTILKQGVEVWNKWYKDSLALSQVLVIPDLSEIDLSEIDLTGAYLWRADFTKAILRNSKLQNACLRGASFIGVDLNGADLRGADLSVAFFQGTDLSGADLRGADLSLADLIETNFNGADLGECNFRDADMAGIDISQCLVSYTMFINVDLSDVKGLNAVIHRAPSTIGIDTIYKSHGNIPDIFLRGCGVPDQMIEHVRLQTATPIQYYSCFISYSHKDEEFAQRLHADLQSKNVRCWFAPHDLPIGAKTRPSIDEAIKVHDKLLLILTEHSVKSNWVEHEAEHAFDLETERGKLVLFPVRLDDAVMDSKAGWAANVKRQRNIGDFTRWKDHDAYKVSFERLLRDLKAGK